jgi:excisionase family DNA binding protein
MSELLEKLETNAAQNLLNIRENGAHLETQAIVSLIETHTRRIVGEMMREQSRDVSHAPDRMMTIEQAAEFLTISPRTLYTLIEQKKIPHRRIGASIRFLRSELLACSLVEAKHAEPENQNTKKKTLKVVK